MKTTCKRCKMWEENGEALDMHIQSYIASLDETLKVSRVQYEERLALCENCDALLNGMCKWCGCFVLARAAKKNLQCPYPKASRW